MTCGHRHGAFTGEYNHWLCGQCKQWLDGRPVRYSGGIGEFVSYNIEWQAEIKVSSEGTTLDDFLCALVKALRLKGGMDKEGAWEYALDLFRSIDEPFGAKDWDWSADGAAELVKEDMEYWDIDEGEEGN